MVIHNKRYKQRPHSINKNCSDFKVIFLCCIVICVNVITHRFMDSELDLNDEIQKLHVIATVPHLYHQLVEVNAIGTILGLLSHENSGTVFILVFILLLPQSVMLLPFLWMKPSHAYLRI